MRKILDALVVIFVIIVILFLAFYCFYVLLGNGYYQSSLPDSLVTIVDELLEFPPTRPTFIGDVIPPEGSVISPIARVCVIVHPTGLVNGTTIDTAIENISAAATRIKVNGQTLARSQVNISIVAILDRLSDGRLTARHSACFQLNWQAGSHLIELYTSPSFLGLIELGQSYTYQWAYVVDSAE